MLILLPRLFRPVAVLAFLASSLVSAGSAGAPESELDEAPSNAVPCKAAVPRAETSLKNANDAAAVASAAFTASKATVDQATAAVAAETAKIPPDLAPNATPAQKYAWSKTNSEVRAKIAELQKVADAASAARVKLGTKNAQAANDVQRAKTYLDDVKRSCLK